MALTGHETLSHQIRLADSIAMSTGNSAYYTLYRADRDVEIKEAGFCISGNATVTDNAPTTANLVVELWNLGTNFANATKIATSTVLGGSSGGATQILPSDYVTIATTDSMNDLTNEEVSEDQIVAFKFVATNSPANADLTRPVGRLFYSATE